MKRFTKQQYNELMRKYKKCDNGYEIKKLIQLLYMVVNNVDKGICATVRIENTAYKHRTAYIMLLNDKIELDFRASDVNFKFITEDFKMTSIIDYLYETMNPTEENNHYCVSLL